MTPEAPQEAPDRPPSAAARWLERWGVAGSFAWGLAEATLFFVIPDVIVGAVALFVPRKAVWAATAAIGGAVLGGVVLFSWAQASESSARDAILAVPAIHPWMLTQAGRQLSENGSLFILAAAFTGIPYKVLALEMTAHGWSLPSLAAWTVPARALRFAMVAALAAAFGVAAKGWVARRPGMALALWLAIWVAVYAEYWTRVGF